MKLHDFGTAAVLGNDVGNVLIGIR
jgi:hypothetical protein